MAEQDVLPPAQPGGLFLGFDLAPPAFAAPQSTGQNHDRNMEGSNGPAIMELPPMQAPQTLNLLGLTDQPTSPDLQISVPTVTAEPVDGEVNDEDEGAGDDGNGDEGDTGSDSENEEGSHRENNASESYPWQPIQEDKSEPCDDELAFITSKEEHSALDHAYWEKETFFDLEDPELVPGESGRIQWLVERLNGTKENPIKELIMRSPKVNIGGLEWQIKFYPKGNRTEFLSLYVECTSMLQPDYKSQEDMTSPPLPVIADYDTKLTKRRSVAAQVSLVMYNPAEPRTYEYKSDAHQFHSKSADFGWKYFSSDTRQDFHFRRHGQRQAILREDKLAFSAYIRIVNDPTGCMWDHERSEDRSMITSLRPLGVRSSLAAATIPLFHFRPFRLNLYAMQSASEDKSSIFAQFKIWLERMMGRTIKRKHYKYSPYARYPEMRDTVEVLNDIREQFHKEGSIAIGGELDSLFSSFIEKTGALVGGRRLKTTSQPSVQAALENVREHFMYRPPLLLLELERQRFDRRNRKWKKLTNRVEIEDHVTYADQTYTLHAFVTHAGELSSGLYTPYVRPGGQQGLWYAYEEDQVRALTRKQAVESHCGIDKKAGGKQDSKDFAFSSVDGSSTSTDASEVAYLLFYIRDDCAPYAFSLPSEESWDVPEYARKHRKTESAKDRNSKHDCTNGHHDAEKTAPVPPPPVPAAAVSMNDPAVRHARRRGFRDLAWNEMERLYSSPRGHAGGLTFPPPVPPPAPADFMDGDDVVMSDVEDGSSPSHTPIDGMLYGKAEDNAAGDFEPQLSHLVVDYFGREYYKGQATLENKYHGEGLLIATNGDEYIGSFAHGLPHGNGKMVYSVTGNTYEGEWAKGKHHGQGTLTERKTGNVYVGGWQHGKRHGAFTLTGTVTEEDKQCCQICYEKDMRTAFYECGHVVACKDCASKIEVCPVCRKRVLARIELYGVNISME